MIMKWESTVTNNDPDCSCRDCGYKWVHTDTK